MDEYEGNPRTAELAAVSEDDLLAQQEDFIAQALRPAANVTRVARRVSPVVPTPVAPPAVGGGASSSSFRDEGRTYHKGATAGVAVHREMGVGGPDGNIRGDDLDANTEEELLQMQEEFLKQHSTPSAKVTRITRRGPAAAAATAASPDDASSRSGNATVAASGQEPGAAAPVESEPGVAVGAPPQLRPSAPSPGPLAAAREGGGCGNGASGDGAGDGAGGGPGSGGAAAQRPCQQEPTSILAPIEGLLGNVVERPSVVPDAAALATVARDVVVAPTPDMPAAVAQAGGPAAPFPEATHRRQSKFALSRKVKQQAGDGATSAAASSSSLLGPRRAAASGAVTAGSLSNWSILPTGPTGAVPAAPGDLHRDDAAAAGGGRGGGGGGGEADELGSIGAHNVDAVSCMRPEEVAAALDELSSRMSPEAMEFLRQRGAQRLQQQQQQQLEGRVGRGEGKGQHRDEAAGSSRVSAAAAAAGRGAGSGRLAELGMVPGRGPAGGGAFSGAPVEASCATQVDSNALIDGALRALTGGGAGGGASVAEGLSASLAAPGNAVGSVPIGALLEAQQRQQQQGGAERHGAGGGPAAGTAAQGAEAVTRGTPADPRLVARLRFDVDLTVVGVQGPDETFVEEEVLLRDQLRRDEGSAPPGYTLGELLVLCRSAVAPQRVAGLTTIADLAATSRPRPEDMALHAPGGAAAEAAGKGREREWAPGQMLRRFVPISEQLRSSAPANCVSWQEVWQFFVSELGLVSHLRLALDDDRPAVVAAAAAALAAVLARSESEQLAGEMADACPSTGWPAPPGGYLSRHGITAPWEPQPLAQPPPGSTPSPSAPGADDEPDPPEDVALVDPVSGALQMGLLQRARYLLASRHSPGAVLPLLAVLCAAARAGSETALAVVREPGLLAAVGALLDPSAAVAAAWEPEAEAVPSLEGFSADGPEAPRTPGGADGAAAGVNGGGGRVAGARSAQPGPRQGPWGAAVQVAALMLVRLLCCASSVAAQLVRAAGLLAHVQAYILLAAPSGGGGGPQQLSHCDAPTPLQLLRLEALRCWRACAHHGIALASLDDMYGNICHLLPPPVGHDPPAPASAASAAALRQLTAAEVYLLLAALVRHSLAVAGGDATIGHSMFGPGAAAVLAAEALAWLRSAGLRGVAAAAVARCNLCVPLLSAAGSSASTARSAAPATAGAGGPSGGLLRTLLGVHPAVLLPRAAAHVACLAAVASFLATYWATVGGTESAFADVRLVVEASGLLQADDPQQQQQLFPPVSATDALAIALLRVPSGAGGDAAGSTAGGSQELTQLPEEQQRQQQQRGADGVGRGGSVVGRALASWALAVLGGQYGGTESDSGEKGLRLGAMAQGCLQVAAAALLYGTLQLAAAVHCDDPAAATGPLAAAVVAAAAPLCCQAAAAIPTMAGRVLCPWHSAAMQRQLHITRLLFLAGTLLPPPYYMYDTDDVAGAGCDDAAGAAPAAAGSGQAESAGRAQGGQQRQWAREERQQVQSWLLEGCLSALSTAPPGAEGFCLQALRLAMRGELLQRPLAAAQAAVTQLTTSNAKLALAAAGVPYTATAADGPFPLPQAAPAAADIAEVLFESYAASWLSLISQRRLAGAAGAPVTAATPASAGTPPGPPAPFPSASLPRVDPLELTPVSLQGQRGSRMPAPGQWAMLEAHRLPYRQQPRQPAGQPPPAPPPPPPQLHPVGCALMLSLGREVVGGGGSGGGALRWLPDGAKEQAALQAAYLFRAGEMVPQDADEASEGSWREPLVRWALAGLSQRYLGSREGWREGSQARPPGPPGPEWLPPALAERLVSALCSACFGDPLLAAHLALALAPAASPVVRLQVWNGLAAEKSLHLLPPLSRCLGGAAQCLGPAAATLAAPLESLSPAPTPFPDPDPDPAFLAALQRSLIEGDLDRAISAPPPASPHCEPSAHFTSPAAAPLPTYADACASLAGEVALHQLGSYLLRRERWPALERAWKRSGQVTATPQPEGSELKGGSGGGDGGGGRGAFAGAAMLGGLVRTVPPEVVAQLVLFAEGRCGVRREELAAVLAQTCGGDVELRERVRHVLALCGMV